MRPKSKRRAGHGVMQHLFGGMALDARVSLRRLAASRSSTVIAVGVLGLAIGIGAAVFSVVDAVTLRRLPLGDPGHIMAVLETDATEATPASGGRTTPQTYLDWRRMQTSFESLACTEELPLAITNEQGEVAVLRALAVTQEFFSVVGVRPMLGHPFAVDEDESEPLRVGRDRALPVILGYDLWQRRFNGARDIAGRTVLLGPHSVEVAGVMPKGFTYPLGADRRTDLYVPLDVDPALRERRMVNGRWGARFFLWDVIGRLRPGVSVQQATSQMNAVEAAIDAEYPTWRPGARVRVVPLHEHLVGTAGSWMLMLIGVVGIVLAIACVNLGNLRVAEAVGRERDLAVSAALGASRWRTTRAFLVESLMLAGAGAGLGGALAWGGVRVLRAWLPQELFRIADPQIDLRVLGALLAASLATGLLAGLAPGLVRLCGCRLNFADGGGAAAARGSGWRRITHALVVGEVALAVALLVAAGLFVASFARLMQVDSGFDPRRVLSLDIQLPVGKSGGADPFGPARTAIERVREAVRAVPGVVAAEVTDGGMPLSGVKREREKVVLPPRGELGSEEDRADVCVVTPGHLALLRVPLLGGRYISIDDRAHTTPVVLINRAAARRYWPGQEPVGRRVTVREAERTVVGIVGNVRQDGPELPAREAFYLPLAQSGFFTLTLAVRTANDPLAALPAVKRAIWSVLPGYPFLDTTVTLEASMDRLTAWRRFSTALLALFGVLGLAIAAVGVYGVLAHLVAQRTQEIGIRMALGAAPAGVVRIVLARVTGLVILGVFLGAGISVWAARFAASMLFGVTPRERRRVGDRARRRGAAGWVAARTAGGTHRPGDRAAQRVAAGECGAVDGE